MTCVLYKVFQICQRDIQKTNLTNDQNAQTMAYGFVTFIYLGFQVPLEV